MENLIILGTQDSGPAHYLITLDEFIGNSFWVLSPHVEYLLKGKPSIPHSELNIASLIVTGTSLGNSLDKKLLTVANKNNIPSISIIEHWSWYRKRFELDRKMVLPDHIVVNDDYARSQAINDGLPAGKIFVGGNPY